MQLHRLLVAVVLWFKSSLITKHVALDSMTLFQVYIRHPLQGQRICAKIFSQLSAPPPPVLTPS